MTSDQERKLPFSQRTGLAPIPPQLKLGEISPELRRLLWYATYKDFKACVKHQAFLYGVERWETLLLDIHVRILKGMPDQFENRTEVHERAMNQLFKSSDLGPLIDFVEFLLGHPDGSLSLRKDLASAFVDARAAYRVVSDSVIAIGTDEQAKVIERAINDAKEASAVGVRTHLINAGKALSHSDWSGSVRESIHAVESISVQLAPDKNTIGAALGALESKGHLHGALKTAFSSLYGYTSDEEGVRHALVFSDEVQVDEGDALFMFGACASFVSYLIAKGNSAGLISQGG
jgi:hypothetical protein